MCADSVKCPNCQVSAEAKMRLSCHRRPPSLRIEILRVEIQSGALIGYLLLPVAQLIPRLVAEPTPLGFHRPLGGREPRQATA